MKMKDKAFAQEVLLQQKINGLDLKKPRTSHSIKKLSLDTKITEAHKFIT